MRRWELLPFWKVGAYGGFAVLDALPKRIERRRIRPAKTSKASCFVRVQPIKIAQAGRFAASTVASRPAPPNPPNPPNLRSPQKLRRRRRACRRKSAVEKIADGVNDLACDPPCSGKQRCANGTCQKLGWRRKFRELDSDCYFCFSADGRVKICTTKDCNQCGLLGLQCLQGNGRKQGCYYRWYIDPVPDKGASDQL